MLNAEGCRPAWRHDVPLARAMGVSLRRAAALLRRCAADNAELPGLPGVVACKDLRSDRIDEGADARPHHGMSDVQAHFSTTLTPDAAALLMPWFSPPPRVALKAPVAVPLPVVPRP